MTYRHAFDAEKARPLPRNALAFNVVISSISHLDTLLSCRLAPRAAR